MRAKAPENAILTVESEPEVQGRQRIFTYTAPNAPAGFTPWRYRVRTDVADTFYSSEAEAKEAKLQSFAAARPTCPKPYIAKESDWIGITYFSAPLNQQSYFDRKDLAIVHWQIQSDNQCHLVNNVNPQINSNIDRFRDLECQAPAPYKGFYFNDYLAGIKGADPWSCYYTVKGKVIGSTVLSGCKEGNPCNVRTGDKIETVTDYRGPFLTFTRTYHSLSQSPQGELGIGWSHNYSDRLSFTGNTLWGVILGSGYQVSLTTPQGGTDYYRSTDQPILEVRRIPGGWVLHRDGGNRDVFDPQGRLIGRETPDGQRSVIGRDAATGRLSQVRDPAGRTLDFEYDATGRLSALREPSGERITFEYDSIGHLLRVEYPDQKSRRYLYEDPQFPHALTGILDEADHRFSTYRYDALGRAISSEHANGAGKITLQYGLLAAEPFTVKVTDALNNQRIYAYPSASSNQVSSITRQCPECGTGQTRTYTYYGLQPIAARDELGITTSYTYDLVRELETRRIEANGTAQARTILTQWHPTLRIPTQITEPTQRINFSYDDSGRLLSRTETALDTNNQRIWSYAYNTLGQRISEDGPRTDLNDVTTYTYWPMDATCPGAEESIGMAQGCRGQLQRQTNALGHVTDYLKYNAHGQLLHQRDPNGVETRFSYDGRQRLTTRQYGSLLTTYRYDPRGLLDQTQLPGGLVLTYQYDDAQRLTKITDNAGNQTTYTLDAAGNRLQESLYDSTGVLTRQVHREFDSQSRLQRERLGVAP